MSDLATLAATLLANFQTIRIPATERREGHADWWAKAKARQAERRAAYACRDRLLRELAEHGYLRFLHYLEPDLAGGWRLHIFFFDDTAISVLDQLTEWTCGPGDPLSFDAEEFVLKRIRHLISNTSDC